jgi:hypothetical protein
MKRLFQIILGIGLMLMPLTILPGCKTSPETVAYRSVATTAASVDTAMRVYSRWAAQEEAAIAALPAADRGSRESDLLRLDGKVLQAYTKYNAAMKLAEVGQRLSGTVSPEFSAAASDLVTLVQESTK